MSPDYFETESEESVLFVRTAMIICFTIIFITYKSLLL